MCRIEARFKEFSPRITVERKSVDDFCVDVSAEVAYRLRHGSTRGTDTEVSFKMYTGGENVHSQVVLRGDGIFVDSGQAGTLLSKVSM